MTNIPDIQIHQDLETLHVHSQRTLTSLSSAVVGGGWCRVRDMLIRHVDKDYHQPDPETDLLCFARQQAIESPFVGMLTAACLTQSSILNLHHEGLNLCAVLTAGLSNVTAAGISPPLSLRQHGTINMLLIFDGNLAPAAMVNAVITATEAKTNVLQQRTIRCSEGVLATGTSTDAIAVAITGRGELLPYAGPVTPAGWLVAQAVRQGLNEIIDHLKL
jgi:adenosylcobinamide hydrolase